MTSRFQNDTWKMCHRVIVKAIGRIKTERKQF